MVLDNLEVVTDNSGRINYFLGGGDEGFLITPPAIGLIMDGDEQVDFKGVKYNLHESGSLVHPEVEVPDSVILHAGVLLREGVEFKPTNPATGEDEPIFIGSGSRIQGTEVHGGVVIDTRALVLARYIGRGAYVGPNARLRDGVQVGSLAVIGMSAKVDRDSQVGEGATVEFAAQLGYRTRVGEGATVTKNSKVGDSTGVRQRGVNQDGTFIPPHTTYSVGS